LDMDEAFCVITTPGTKKPKYVAPEHRPPGSSLGCHHPPRPRLPLPAGFTKSSNMASAFSLGVMLPACG
jgi:hypothetical protein